MKNNKIIGIIGQGFVGSAVREKFKKSFRVFAWDKKWDNLKQFSGNNETSIANYDQLEEIVRHSEFVFVCVPTPMYEDGQCDTSIVESVLSEINNACEKLGKQTIAIVKSTISPGTTNRLNGMFDKINVMFNPEFLTEANAITDYDNQTRIIIGSDEFNSDEAIVNKAFKAIFPKADIVFMKRKDAEMVKYMTNLFLATKVSFFNDMYRFCQVIGADYDQVIQATMLDPRIGQSHFMVPGPDGDFGYGGHCFPGHYTVSTLSGEIRLDELYDLFKSGELLIVKSFNDTLSGADIKHVTSVTKNQYKGELYKFTLENDKIIECTPEHIFPINRDGRLTLVQAKDIVNSDIFYTSDEIYNKKAVTTNDTELL